MAEQCRDCGAELAPGQRFCRRCGVAVARPSVEEAPTKVFHPNGQPNVPTMPSLLSTQATAPVYQQPTARQSPPTQREAGRPASHSRGKSHWMRYLLLVLAGLLASTLIAGFLIARIARRIASVRGKTPAPASAPVKAGTNNPGKPAAAMMSEEGATVTKDQTVIKRTYPLGDNSSVSLVNLSGKIKIEGWDEAQAEVRVIKEGGSEQDRQAVQIKLDNRSDLLSLETSPTRSSPVEVHYELKLPRRLRELQIKSADSEVELSDITGAITVDVQGSSIELTDVGGSINTKIVQGETKATVNGKLNGPQALKSVNGDIELQLTAETNADISAETIDGEIEVGDNLNLKVEKRRVGEAVSGRIGTGGVPISIKTVNGDIRIGK
jgi:ribosomal protein L40E